MIGGTFTITFGEVAENHARMQQIGEMAENGFTVQELKEAKIHIEERGFKCEFIDLGKAIDEQVEDAGVLLVKKGCKLFGIPDELFIEQANLRYDKKALMYGRVVNKKARHNICFSDDDQDPNYEKGEGTVVSFEKVPHLKNIRENLHLYFGDKAKSLNAEGNYYYNPTECGIGYHGDSERKIVIAIRLGETLPLHYNWFHKNKPVGTTVELKIEHGDLYIMSEKATGNDWKKKNVYTLRHAAGSKKFLKLNK